MPARKKKPGSSDPTARYAAMLAALGTGYRLRILRLLLSAYPGGMVVGEIQAEIGIPPSTLSHHLERLRAEGLVSVRRERTFLRYLADARALEELLEFLLSECCRRSRAVRAETVIRFCGVGRKGRCP